MTLAYLLALPAVKGAIAGALAAAVVDFHAFRSWKAWHDVTDYNWSTASFRWFSGAVIGAVTALGLTPTL
jgi:hypothetical protein